ncbi:putative repeat protein (TIGR01451 family) [Streptomyces sp. V4I8]
MVDTPAPNVDLQVVKTGPASVMAGASFSYTITVTNNGPAASKGWTITDTLPPVSRTPPPPPPAAASAAPR